MRIAATHLDWMTRITRNGTTLYTFTDDSHGRVQTLTDLRAVFNSQSDWSVTLAYDNLDRLTRETFLDGTSRCGQYTNLDITNFSDRQQWSAPPHEPYVHRVCEHAKSKAFNGRGRDGSVVIDSDPFYPLNCTF